MRRLAPFYSKGPDLVVFNDVEPVKFNSWKEFADAESKIMAKFLWWKNTPRNLMIRVWDEVALSTATPTLTGESKSRKKYRLTLRHTAVWRKERGRWLIMHDHWSIPWPSS